MNLKSALKKLHSLALKLGVQGFIFDKIRFEVLEVLLKDETFVDLEELKWFDTNLSFLTVKQIPNHRLIEIIYELKERQDKTVKYYGISISDWISILVLEGESRRMRESYEEALLSLATKSLEVNLLMTFIDNLSENSVNLRHELLCQLQSADIELKLMKLQMNLV